MLDGEGLPGGELSFDSDTIWVADQAMLDYIATNPTVDDLTTALAAPPEVPTPYGYVEGGSVSFIVGNSLLVQNTGSDSEYGGITTGSGGLHIIPADGGGPILLASNIVAAEAAVPLVIAFGHSINPDHTNDDFFFDTFGNGVGPGHLRRQQYAEPL